MHFCGGGVGGRMCVWEGGWGGGVEALWLEHWVGTW